MSAPERLREAGKVLRERAKAADILSDREPWAIWPDLTEGGFVHVGNAGGVIPEGEFAIEGEHNLVAKVYTPELAHYIATMHPGVGLALADWLYEMANDLTPDNCRTPLRLADLILGGEDQ